MTRHRHRHRQLSSVSSAPSPSSCRGGGVSRGVAARRREKMNASSRSASAAHAVAARGAAVPPPTRGGTRMPRRQREVADVRGVPGGREGDGWSGIVREPKQRRAMKRRCGTGNAVEADTSAAASDEDRSGAVGDANAAASSESTAGDGAGVADDGERVSKSMSRTAKKVASTFAPRSSTARGKNPAVKGSVLYTVFEVQAALSLVAGGLLAFNVVLPSDEPSIARLMGMWMCWILTVPSLRARDCEEREKDALNLLFLLIPIINVTIPFFWKSFAAVYSADVVALAAVYCVKMEWLSERK